LEDPKLGGDMSLLGKKKVSCPGGRWTTLISNFGTGMPKTFTVSFTSESDSYIGGEFVEKKYFWIFPKTPVKGQLVPLMEFHRDWINGIYSVKVKPENDVTAEFV
jgi:hypothetical protein